MRDNYFKPLRRKLGVVTLVTACGLLGGWVRSLYAIDTAIIPLGITHFAWLWSADSSHCWHTMERSDDSSLFFPEFYSREFTENDTRIFEHPVWGVERDWCGFGFEVHEDGTRKGVAPYWSVVIPHTADAAFRVVATLLPASDENP